MASWLMRVVMSSGKSIGKRRAICSGLQALAHRRFFRGPCRRPFRGHRSDALTALADRGPSTWHPPFDEGPVV